MAESVKLGTEDRAIRNATGDVVGWTMSSAAKANGWFSRRHKSSDAFREWQDSFAAEAIDKKTRALERQEHRASLTDAQQLERIAKRIVSADGSTSNGEAKREIDRLMRPVVDGKRLSHRDVEAIALHAQTGG